MTANDILFQAATAIFAITGVLAAARQNMDVMSFVIIGVVTAIGGGTMRDITLNAPVFWLQDQRFLYVAATAALATFFLEQRFRATYKAFLYLDAVATAVFAVLATEKTLALGFGSGVAVVMGVITGIGGGIIRDLLTGQPTLLASRELYMTPILFGVIPFVASLDSTHSNSATLAPLAMLVIAILRIGAIRLGWCFPDWLTYKPLK
jgi:uncharacterized membrane protein YeiH